MIVVVGSVGETHQSKMKRGGTGKEIEISNTNLLV